MLLYLLRLNEQVICIRYDGVWYIQNMIYVYRLTCLPTMKIYIGVSKNPKHRFNRHVSNSRYGDNTIKLSRALRKYGSESFILEILSSWGTYEEALKEEITQIEFHDSYFNGLNSSLGGENSSFYRLSKAQKENISLKRKEWYSKHGEDWQKKCQSLESRNSRNEKLKELRKNPEFWLNIRSSSANEKRSNTMKRKSKTEEFKVCSGSSRANFELENYLAKTSESYKRKRKIGSVPGSISYHFDEGLRTLDYLNSIKDLNQRFFERGWIRYLLRKAYLVIEDWTI